MSNVLKSMVAALSALMVATGGAQSHVAAVGQERDLPVFVRATADLPGALNERVDVDVRDQSVRDALKAVLGPTKTEYIVDDDVPHDVRVTVVARGVRLRSVLDLIADAAEVGWRRELGPGKARLRFGKGIRTWLGSRLEIGSVLPDRLDGLHEMLVEPLREGMLWRAHIGNEVRSSITCPHCKVEITRVTRRSSDKCSKCNAEFKAGWKVCPFDGTRRPETTGDWKYCPVCGKTLSGVR